ncbi:heat-inducible transcriptional repressor HrcA [Evansella cellulosilytica]|uniref:Heat-inducible transcription repressor HrcA n=1 Tax=Evansella cellulosilytica (strain ATCC 21833 / DSM 2522 / FERM P-1141 / JCM 9156 / N-4) TaxID=649639 RepID=E6TW26_EVAC2|nr:heat-inducible transcriptional repressor HrcA [Evansella cellulosilytica]ADU29849.1 heat-inducible transcription repressor HrcA [Evansella cellulosilytica DSM 2522]
MLTERQLLILKAIIDDYITHAEPVGSRSVSKREDMTYSPATIRNEMSDLEELGFLEKPHSSAGRIPSQKGYRYYVDHLLSPKKLTKKEITGIQSGFRERFSEIEHVIQQSAKILSNLTSYTSIVLGPEIFESKLKQIQLVPISSDAAVAIIVTDAGHVENQTVTLPTGIKVTDLEKVVNIVNEQLKDVPLVHLRQKLNSEFAKILSTYIDQYDEVMSLLHHTFLSQQHDKVFFSGKTNILAQPEFHDVERVKRLFNIFEEDALMSKLFRSEDKGITIKIGQENRFEPFDDCTVITATYTVEGKHMGTVGILGPTRMEYPRVIGIMDYLTKDLSKLLSNRYQK